MAAPEIPNLLSLLSSRGGGGARSARGALRSRGSSSSRNPTLPHGPTPTGAPSPPSFAHPASSRGAARNAASTSTDAVIAATDTDAAGSRLSAVRAGWLEDDFAEAFYAAPDARSVRRMPIINRGTYVRTTAVDALVGDFLDEYADAQAGSKTCQVVSLGAGTDTRWARFSRDPLVKAKMRACRWIEVDFAETMDGKRGMLERAGFADAVAQGQDWVGVAMDLRELVSAGGPEDGSGQAAQESKLAQAVDGSLPTLLLSEMCLTYLPPASASTPALAAIAGSLIPEPTPLHAVLYEPLAPSDAFGRTMIQNLAGRGIKLPGLEGLPTLDSHGQRLTEVGFEEFQAMTVGHWWRDKVGAAEKDRLRAVEMVDEEEEWDLLAGHYGVVWAWRNRTQS